MNISCRPIAAGFAFVLLAIPVHAQQVDPDNALVMELKCGEVVISCGPTWRRAMWNASRS
jgi:hypothetical protein